MRRITALFLGLAVLAHAGVAWAEKECTLQQVGYGAASVLGTVAYVPLKATLCFFGSLSSGAVFVFDRETAATVLGAGCGGTWLITPDVLAGRKAFEFVGEP